MATLSDSERTTVLSAMAGAAAGELFFSDAAGTYLARGSSRPPLRLTGKRLRLARQEPDPLLVVPVGDLARQALAGLCMLDGIDRLSLLGASGDARVPGLGFRYDEDERWPVPNPTGREGVFAACCPPHQADMRAALDALERVPDPRLRDCVALQAQYLFETYGKFPATVPSVMAVNYLEVCHI